MQPKQLTEVEVRRIIQDEMDKNYRSGTPKIPKHRHNGIDNLKIEQKNIKISDIANPLIISNSSETFTIKTPSNPRMISFYGYAADNQSGGSDTHRSYITGVTILANGNEYINESPSSIIPKLGSARSINESCSSMTINFASLSNTTVSASSEHLAYVKEKPSSEIVVTLNVVAYTQTSVTIKSVLKTGWQVTGVYLIT